VARILTSLPKLTSLTQALRRGTFSSVKALVTKIDHYVKNSNRHAQPFVWTATPDSIFAKVERLCERIYGTAH
jgi:putative transposase